MATAADKRAGRRLKGIGALLAPYPGRAEFAARLAVICTLAMLVAEIYRLPEPALTAYVAFFVTKQDRVSSVVTSVVMTVLITAIIGLLLMIAMHVLDQPVYRVAVMVGLSLALTFAASASKLRSIGGIVALIAAYALDLLGTVPGGEAATRGLLHVWLFVAIPATACVIVNLAIGPAPRRLAERALARQLRLAAGMLAATVGTPASDRLKRGLSECVEDIPTWLKAAAMEKTSPQQDIAALRQAARTTVAILSLADFLGGMKPELPPSLRARMAATLESMAVILDRGGYPIDIQLEHGQDEAALTPAATAALDELRAALDAYAVPVVSGISPEPRKGGFFLPDAFTNEAHVHYALKTTGAAMFCYMVYLLLDWPGIHTCLITCYIVSLGSVAETMEKQTLRFSGCLLGAGAGLGAIICVMPYVTSIGGLMAVVFPVAFLSAWIAAGGPRISYLGLQLAFAFFLSVIQGSAPAFDMTVARDRTIGILFGNMVVSLVFTLILPLSIKGSVDAALGALLRRLADPAPGRSSSERWALAAETTSKLGMVERNIELARYEPLSIRPPKAWLKRRRDTLSELWSLQAILLLGVGQDPGAYARTLHRLGELACRFGSAPDQAPEGAAGDAAV